MSIVINRGHGNAENAYSPALAGHIVAHPILYLPRVDIQVEEHDKAWLISLTQRFKMCHITVRKAFIDGGAGHIQSRCPQPA